MDYSEITDKVCGIVADIFECDPRALSGETRLMTDLPCESIDLLEIGARLGQTFHILVDDDVVFLRSLRYHVAHGGEPEAVIRREYPYLSPERVKALALGLSNPDAVPQLCLDDIAAYIRAALPSQEYEEGRHHRHRLLYQPRMGAGRHRAGVCRRMPGVRPKRSLAGVFCLPRFRFGR